MAKKSDKKCNFCKKIINPKERKVLLGTYEGDKTIEEGHYHIQCFSKWFNSKVTEKAQASTRMIQEKAMGLYGDIKKLTGGLGGLENIGKMLGINLKQKEQLQGVLGIDINDILGLVEEQKKDGKQKR